MPKAVVETRFAARDHLTPALKRMGAASGIFSGKLTRGLRRATKQASMFRSVFGGMVLANAFSRGAAMAGLAVRELGAEFLDFDKSITKAVSRLQDPKTGMPLTRSSQEFAKFSKIARDEAKRTEFTAAETAKGLENLAMAGFDVKQSMGALPGVLQLATNADIDVTDATMKATKMLGAFGMRTKNTAELVANLGKVNDVFSYTITSGALDIEMMYEALKYMGPNAYAAGQSLSTMAAITAFLADRSIDASTAGTQMRMVLAKLATPKTVKGLRELGIAVADEKGNYRDIVTILGELNEKTKKLGTQKKGEIIKDLFDVRAMTSINALMAAGSKELDKFRKKIDGASGVAKAMSDNIRDSLIVRLQRLKSVAIERGFEVIEGLLGKKLGKGIDDLIWSLEKFDTKPVIDGLREVVGWVDKLWSASKPIRDNWQTALGLFIAFKTVAAGFRLAGLVKDIAALGTALKAAAITGSISIGVLGFALFGLAATIAILATNWNSVVLGFEESFAKLHLLFAGLWVRVKQFAADVVNAMAQVAWEIPKVLTKGTLLEDWFEGAKGAPKVSFVDQSDIEGLKRIEGTIKSIQEEAVFGEEGVVRRGAAGFRGYVDPRDEALSLASFGGGMSVDPSLIAESFPDFMSIDPFLSEKQREVSPSESKAKAEAQQLDVNISFENLPEGARAESKGSPGIASVSYSGLGDN